MATVFKDFTLRSLLNLSVDFKLNRLDRSRIQLLNRLILIVILICLIMTVVTLIEGLLRQSIIIFGGTVILALNFILVYKKRHELAKSYFITFTSLIIVSLSINAYQQGLFTEIENLIFPMMALCILLFESKARNYSYWILFIILIGLKTYRGIFNAESYDLSFYITIQNTTIFAVLLYLFLVFFYNVLVKSIKDIAASQKDLYNTIDNLSVFVALFNPDGSFKVVNKFYEKAFNKTRAEIIGKQAHDIMPKHVADWQKKVIDDAIKTKNSIKTKKELTLDDNSYFVGYGRANPILNEKEEVVAISGYISNVAELESIKQRLEIANKSKDRIFSIISHDLRSPLNTFESILNSTKYEIITSENFDDFIEDLRCRFLPIKDTITDLLQWSKANLSDIQASSTTFDIKLMVDEIITFNKPAIKVKKLKISNNLETQMISADPDHIKICLRNIIQNAVKFSPKKGNIIIKEIADDQFVCIAVTDEGEGISAEKINQIKEGKLVEPGIGSTGEKGTGIGLSMVTELLKKNNCDFDIKSQMGSGSTFIIKIAKNTSN